MRQPSQPDGKIDCTLLYRWFVRHWMTSSLSRFLLNFQSVPLFINYFQSSAGRPHSTWAQSTERSWPDVSYPLKVNLGQTATKRTTTQ
jgi:hypothetical protein